MERAEKIIDFHVHPFDNPKYSLNMYPESYEADAATLKRQLADAGITHICGSVLNLGYRPDGFESLKALNREALRLREQMGEFYTPGFHIHPAFVRESCDEIEFMHSQGVRLIGELVPYMHAWGEFEEKNWMEIMDVAEQYRMICSYHTPFDYNMNKMLQSHPGITFVAAHPGDKERVYAWPEMLKAHSNLCLDLSGTGLFRFGMLKYLVHKVGAERILFGTDYPICNPRMYVEAVYGEEITESEREQIFYENAARILDLS